MSSQLKPSDVERVDEAIRGADLSEFEAGTDLNVLSTRTEIDDIDVDRETVSVQGNEITGNVNVSVSLHFGAKEDEVVIGEWFPGKFKAHKEGTKIVVDQITVDTSAFDQ